MLDKYIFRRHDFFLPIWDFFTTICLRSFVHSNFDMKKKVFIFFMKPEKKFNIKNWAGRGPNKDGNGRQYSDGDRE